MDFDLVITNGTIIDGTGSQRFRGDIGIQKGKIAAVSTGETLSGRQTLDATGLVVSPGFIDVHSHSEWILPLPDHHKILAPLVLQGITTIVAGQCGISPAPVTDHSIPLLDAATTITSDSEFSFNWRSIGEFLDSMEREGLLLNLALMVGHSTLRLTEMGIRADAPTEEEMEALQRRTRQAIREGAFGLSAGLPYVPGIFARNEELLSLLRTTAEEGGVFTVHGRAYTWVSTFYKPMILGTPHNIRSVRELLDLASQTGVRIQLSHQIFVGRRTWRTYHTVLEDIERAASDGVDVSFDAFPYTAGNTTVNIVFPEWFLDGFKENINHPRLLRKVKREIDLLRWALGLDYGDITLLWGCDPTLSEYEGLDFTAISRRMGLSQFEAYMHVARLSEGKARVLVSTYSGDGEYEEPLQAVLTHPLCAFETDTHLTKLGVHNPASFGNFPKVLGRYSRELELFSLEEAVRRMTSFPAERTRIKDLGRIAEGHWGDLVLFDPKTIADNTTPNRLDAPPTGIHAVLISGQVVVREGEIITQERHGRVLRR
jgi:N-acyl-D-amino-acid deacylase